ncbi:hypothetical protein BG015_003615 [Linnemannia schmuckeri]|uniref:F-box domain-containing protein n=1 Tax=Linnemannia schmuckeri TaxID=64567 RepID=A0A9P5V356_9FUNG|nr:hypothetical protein BG015_003615 [Linnemannia schmuckeri]
MPAAQYDTAVNTPAPLEHHQQAQQQPPATIDQLSAFTKLPSELILDIFSYLDIVTIFRFLDTCRYHRYLLLNLPEIWQRVRFIPLSEYSTSNVALASFTTLSAAAAGIGAEARVGAEATVAAAGPSRYRRPVRTKKPSWQRDDSESSSNSESESVSDRSDDTKITTTTTTTASNASTTTVAGSTAAHRLKHAENERDRERGGSRSLISEIYAVLRRFRKENRLVDFVREIYMDSTDSQHFPSPLVMLIKFPNLHTLSSRYRRNQTSLTTDTHTLKDLLRNGDILPHSLKLRKWDIFHPYMTEEDVVGFKGILDAISAVGGVSSETKDLNGSGAEGSGSKAQGGVVLDIKMCPGPIVYEPNPNSSTNQAVYTGSGMHWAAPNNQPPASTLPPTIPPTTATPPPPPQDAPSPTPTPTQPTCTNIVWTLEKCRVCDASQDRCYRCVGQCRACGAIRAPPFINHQTLLERERARQTSVRAASATTAIGTTSSSGASQVTGLAAGGSAVLNGTGRPRTPPGSISLSQMANPGAQPIMSTYYPLSASPSMTTSAATAASIMAPSLLLSGLTSPPPVVAPVALALPPEFSLFD